MLTCKITDFSRPSQTVKSSCRARFSVTLSVDDQPLVEMSDVFWEFMWKEIIGLLVAVGTGGLWLLLSAGVFGTTV